MSKSSLRESHIQIGVIDLRLVLALGEAGTLSAAARRLGMDHSSAFRRLNALEQRLAAQLFERARDGYTPTPAGEIALAAARRVCGELGELERRLAGEDLRPSGTVRVTTADTLIPLLGPVFAALRRTQPGVVVEVISSAAFFTLTHRDADIAVRPAAAAPEGLVARRIAGIAFAAFAAPRYLGSHRELVLTNHDWIGLESSLEHLATAQWMARELPAERIVHRTNSLSAMQAAAGAGLGVAALPCYLGDRDADLERLGPPRPEWAVSLWLLTHPDLRRVARVRAVLDVLAERLTAQRPLLEGREPRRAGRVREN